MTRSATILGVTIDHPSALEIGSRSRGTPRLANRLLKRVRDYAQVRGNGPIELDICRQALEFFEIDELGLDWMDIRILETLAKTFSGRAVGLTTLASAVGEDRVRSRMSMSLSAAVRLDDSHAPGPPGNASHF